MAVREEAELMLPGIMVWLLQEAVRVEEVLSEALEVLEEVGPMDESSFGIRVLNI